MICHGSTNILKSSHRTYQQHDIINFDAIAYL